MGQTSKNLRFKNYTYSFAFLLAFLLPVFLQAQVQVNVSGTNVTCNGLHNGAATATASGGGSPYTYLWSNGATTGTITNLNPGNYSVSVKDINLGEASGSIIITEPTVLAATVFGQSQICGIAPDGFAAVETYGGTPPYSYLWSNGGVTPKIDHLAAATYTVTITDANQCTVKDSFTVGFWNEGIWLMDSVYQEITCFGAQNGHIHVSAMSGVGPYTYQWSNGDTLPDITNLGPGTYSVTVTDEGTSCFNVTSVELEEPAQLICSPSSIPANCGLNGTAIVSATGGTLPYNFNWSNGQSSPSIAVPAGTYTVTVTDANGCSCSSTVIVLSNSSTLTVNITPAVPAGCVIGGSASAAITGGTGNYAYSWGLDKSET